MNNVKGDGTPIWYGVYDLETKTLQNDVARMGEGDGTLLDNSQTAHRMENGQPVFIYSSVMRSSRQLFLDAMVELGIQNPNNYEIPE